MKFIHPALGALVAVVAGCATYHARPLSPEKSAASFESRSLGDTNLVAFLKTNGFAGDWNLKSLSLVAFYYQPALAEARAQFAATQAAEITAGQRPNPTLSVTPGYDSQIPGNFSPWLVDVSLDVPIETAGKRGKRIAQAQRLTDAAYWNFVGTAWQTRSHVRTALLGLYAARENNRLLAQQQMAESNVVRLLKGQFAAGSVSSFEVTQARVALENTELARWDAVAQVNQARAQLAAALGLPLRALEHVPLSFADFHEFPRALAEPEVRRQALLNRADVRAALAQYAASQAALQLEIANQYPDVHLGPGYSWNTGNAGDNQWTLGLSMTLPMFNQNQGPIAEAKANRETAAAHFLSVQAAAIAEIDSALAGYDAALKKGATAKNLLKDLQRQLDSTRAQAKAGEVDPLTLANAEGEFAIGMQNQLDALIKAQQSLGALEDAVQSPLTLSPKTLKAVEDRFGHKQK